jgi:hypothetical protein
MVALPERRCKELKCHLTSGVETHGRRRDELRKRAMSAHPQETTFGAGCGADILVFLDRSPCFSSRALRALPAAVKIDLWNGPSGSTLLIVAVTRDARGFSVIVALLLAACSSGVKNNPDGSGSGGRASGGSGGAAGMGGAAGAGGQGQGAGGPGSCSESETAQAQCNANSVGVECPGSADPDPTRYDCFANFADASGTRFVCCRVKPAAGSCAADPNATCDAGFSGYSCAGTDTPAASAPVICHPGATANGRTSYCCGSFSSSACSLSTGTTGCGGIKYIFQCAGTNPQRPEATDPWLSCGMVIPNFDNSQFCCSVRPPPVVTCAPDPTVDCTPNTGYSCTGSDAPYDSDPTLVCGNPLPANGETLYCCRH